MHHNPAVFSDPETFNPDRWLANGSIELEKFNVAFSKGSRSCIGMKYVSPILTVSNPADPELS